MSAKPRITPAEALYQLKATNEVNCLTMKRACDFMTAVGRLMEAFANDEVSDEVFTPNIIAGLGTGLQITSQYCWEEAEKAEQRVNRMFPGGEA
ncbi:hypothetical protein [Pseudomonas sp. PS02290]|uniref:hypothetical protein n=1 Tax=Pseudomonas sp. PS02290 TaxID=2991430 RepID=UPI00249C86B3|nr:hypothetical protein [Pseudomonas sp. PS02290]